MKHKHADVIKAWADGAQIQTKRVIKFDSGAMQIDRHWSDVNQDGATFQSGHMYRIKPTADEQTDNHSGICLEVEA